MKTIKREAKKRIIFSNYDIDSYYEDAKQNLIENGLKNPSENQIYDEIYDLMTLDFDEEFDSLKDFFADSPVIAEGHLQRWNGTQSGFSVFSNFLQMWYSMTKDCDYYEIYDCNVCNYERMHHNELNLPVEYPDWYYQKAAHKNDLWFKQLPSQTAQEVCKLLDKSWKSFYVLKQTGGIINPRPPKFKHEAIAVTYMQNGITHTSDTVRLTLSKGLKRYMADEYNINGNYLFLKNRIFKDIGVIKQLKIYPPERNKCTVIVSYEVPDVTPLPDNGKYLSIDIGIHNLLTCYASDSQETFITGRKYLSICNYYYKEIARVQSQWSLQQSRKGIKYPKISKHIQKLYERKNNAISDYLHKITRYIVNYCISNDIHTVIIGDITNIRKDKDLGDITNQKLHSLPFKRLYQMLEYKLKSAGIRFIKQNEAYSSQTSPLADKVCRQNADKKKRVYRGLFVDGNNVWNADCVGAYNILRLYLKNNATGLNPYGIKVPYIVKVAA